MNRRGFLGAILALGAAPAIVRAESLMPIWVPKLWVPTIQILYSDGSWTTLDAKWDWIAICPELSVKAGDTIHVRVPELYRKRSA